MRHKQRPVKSSRHKSVTCIIDSHTSFGDHNVSPARVQGKEAPQQQLPNQSNYLKSPYQASHSHVVQHARSQRSLSPPPSSAYFSGGNGGGSGSNMMATTSRDRLGSGSPFQQQLSKTHLSTGSPYDEDHPLLRKQFEHNYRHMSDVMRLAFLENNDLPMDDFSKVDFNSSSTASILQRNIQQHLQQERRNQLQLRQQQQQQQQHHQNHNHHHHHHHQQQHNHQQQQVQFHQLHEQHHHYQQHDPLDDFDDNNDYYEMSDSKIFATATPPFSGNRNSHSSSRPSVHQAGGSGSGQRRTAESGRKRTRDSIISDESFQSQVQEETIQNYGEGFLCDEPGCDKSFPSLRKLRHHKVVHSDEFPYVCEFNGCGKKFKRKFGIDLHSTTHFDLDPDMYSKTSNNSSLPFFGRRMQYSLCKPCGQKFKTVHEYQYHMLKHGKEPFKCPVKGCGQTFSIWKSFQKHRASHYFNYYCKMDPSRCDHHTSNLQLLKLHIYCCHFQRKLPDNATLASQDAGVEDTGPDLPSQDDSLGVVDSVEHSPQASMKEEGEEEEEFGGEEENASMSALESPPRPVDPPTPRRDSRLRKNPPRFSTYKQQDYASINNGTSFAKSIASPPPVKRTRASGGSSANHHITPRETMKDSIMSDESFQNEVQDETIQNYGEGFLCDKPGCDKSFPSLRKLRHHKVVHSDEFPYVCEFNGCGKKFKRKFGIDLHSTTHFDLDPDMYNKTSNNSSLPFFGRRMQYSLCKPCGQKFKTVHEYQYHMLKHGKEPFKCPVKGCGQTFSIWKSFQKHRASHYFNYYCKMDPSRCDHHTSNLQLLKLHIYCCHFQRKLPDNATLASHDAAVEDAGPDGPSQDDSVGIADSAEQSPRAKVKEEEEEEEDDEEGMGEVEGEDEHDLEQEQDELEGEEENASMSAIETPPMPADPPTPRRDSRLRKNPPRFCTYAQQDYASINNGTSFAKSIASPPPVKRTRASGGSSAGQQVAPRETIKEAIIGEESFKCHLCDYKFSVRFQLTKHLSTHLELTPEMYSATADKQVVQLSERRRREFYCDKCNVKFEQMQELDNHMRKHSPRPYVCCFCQVPSTFRLAKQYLSHLYEHRFNYRCTMAVDCEFTINRKDALKLHIFRMHLNQQLPSYIENFANLLSPAHNSTY